MPEHNQTNLIISNIAKRSSFAYRSAIARNRANPLDELQRRIMRRLRPTYSSDRYSDLIVQVSKLSPFDRQFWLLSMQEQLDAAKHDRAK
jgi:hypothetical protein